MVDLTNSREVFLGVQKGISIGRKFSSSPNIQGAVVQHQFDSRKTGKTDNASIPDGNIGRLDSNNSPNNALNGYQTGDFQETAVNMPVMGQRLFVADDGNLYYLSYTDSSFNLQDSVSLGRVYNGPVIYDDNIVVCRIDPNGDFEVKAYEPTTSDIQEVWSTIVTAPTDDYFIGTEFTVQNGYLIFCIEDNIIIMNPDGDQVSSSKIKHENGDDLNPATTSIPVESGYAYVGQSLVNNNSGTRISKIDIFSGEAEWTKDLGSRAIKAFSGVMLDSSSVYVTQQGNQGAVKSLSKSDGGIEWNYDFADEPISGVNAITDSLVYIATDGSILFAFDSTNGDVIWSASIEASSAGTLQITPSNDRIVAATDHVKAFDATDGTKLWLYDRPDYIYNMQVYDDLIFGQANDGSVHKIGRGSFE